MKIRQLVKRVKCSLVKNPDDWKRNNAFPNRSLSNSRGIDIVARDKSLVPSIIFLRDKWTHSTHKFDLNSSEIIYLLPSFHKYSYLPTKQVINKINKRRGWLVKELLKTL